MSATAALPAFVQAYLQEVVELAQARDPKLVSVIAFGSVLRRDFSDESSDVDLIIVVSDETSLETMQALEGDIMELEKSRGLGGWRHAAASKMGQFLDAFGGLFLSSFVCSRSQLLSGDPAQVFHAGPILELLMVEGIGFAGIISTCKTVWGEDIVDQVRPRAITYVDLAKSSFNLAWQSGFALLTYPFSRNSTRYAVGQLKRALHACYYCHTQAPEETEKEIEFFTRLIGDRAVFRQFFERKHDGVKSFEFMVRSLVAALELHLLTARNVRFPLEPRAGSTLPG